MTHTPNTLPPREALQTLVDALRNRHYGRMPDEVQQAYDNARAALAQSAQAPIDMVLHCPRCGMQHIDAVEPSKYALNDEQRRHTTPDWGNPPHRSHLCHGCGHIWRPADVPTNGVAAIKTKGKEDSPPLQSAQAPAQPAPSVEAVMLAATALEASAEVFDDIERHDDQHKLVAREAAASARRSAALVRSAVEALARGAR